jgi:hypothetical protein
MTTVARQPPPFWPESMRRASPNFPLRTLRAVRREQRLVVLAWNIDPQKPPLPRLAVSEQEALLAPQRPHGGDAVRRSPGTVAERPAGVAGAGVIRQPRPRPYVSGRR